MDSYFAMRKISLAKTRRGGRALLLNNKFVFQVGALDQGYWPDGIYTAPTDDALQYDIEMAKQLGFNLLRKHAKVEPERWYYWTDKLGMLVWQDMPQAFGDLNDDGQSAVADRMAARDRDALQPSVHHRLDDVQRRLGPARHGSRSSR